MSLLMEALRKAEEAKSKATTEEPDQNSPEETQSSSPEPSKTESSQESSTPELQDFPNSDTETVSEEGPAVINPDPDELETLAAHASDDGLSFMDSTSTGPEPATPAPQDEKPAAESSLSLEPMPEEEPKKESEEDEPPVIDDFLNIDEEEDDALSLLESSYFSRTKKPGGLDITDDDLDIGTQDSFEEFMEQSEKEASSEAALIPEEEVASELEEFPPAEEAQPEEVATTPANEIPEDENETLDEPEPVVSKKAEEQEIRRSAGDLFKAKTDNRQQRLRKYLPIAALLLIIPVGGIGYWFYSSMTSTPQMQFNAPPGGLADRGFLGGEVIETETPAVTDASLAQQDGQQADTLAATLGEGADSNIVLQEEITGAVTTEEATEETLQVAQVENPQAPLTPPAANGNALAINATGNNGQQQPVEAVTPGLSFVRTEVVIELDPDLNAAYDSYQEGDYNIAGRLYQQVLNSDPNNRDAMLGLASVYLKQNNIPMSQNLYARLLELNPRDPIARAGLLDISLQDDPVRQEAELKSLINAFPGVAPLSFALGNLFAKQSRWSEAQSEYFNALLTAKSASQGSDVNPDYAFNLAVSLEQLNQPQSALDYYREALEYSRNTVPGFDITLLNQRINTLER